MSSTNFIPMLSSSPPAMGDSFDDSWTHDYDDGFGDFGKFSPPKADIPGSTNPSHPTNPLHQVSDPEQASEFASFASFQGPDAEQHPADHSWAQFGDSSTSIKSETQQQEEFGDFDSFEQSSQPVCSDTLNDNVTEKVNSVVCEKDSEFDSSQNLECPAGESTVDQHMPPVPLECLTADSLTDKQSVDSDDMSDACPPFFKPSGHSSASDSPIHFKEAEVTDNDSVDALEVVDNEACEDNSGRSSPADEQEENLSNFATFQSSDGNLSSSDTLLVDNGSRKSELSCEGNHQTEAVSDDSVETRADVQTDNDNGCISKKDVDNAESIEDAPSEDWLRTELDTNSGESDKENCESFSKGDSALSEGNLDQKNSLEAASLHTDGVVESDTCLENTGNDEETQQKVVDGDDFGDFSTLAASSSEDNSVLPESSQVPTNNCVASEITHSDGLDNGDNFGDFSSFGQDEQDVTDFSTVENVNDASVIDNSSNELASKLPSFADDGDEEDGFGDFADFDHKQQDGDHFSEDEKTNDDWAAFGSATDPNEGDGWASFQAPASHKTEEFGELEQGSEDNDFAAFTEADQGEFEDFGDFKENHSSVSKNNDVDEDHDDFGGFADAGASDGNTRDTQGDFSSSSAHQPDIEHSSTSKPTGLSRVEQLIDACFHTSLSINNQGQGNCFTSLVEISNEKVEGEAPVDRWLPLWSDLCDIDHSVALQHTWNQSKNRKELLTALHIDTRNLLVGHKKQSVPIFATDLGLLQPTRGPQEDKTSIAPQLINTNKDELLKEDALPPVDFDWSSSGLTDPLESKPRNITNKELESEFLSTTSAPFVVSHKTLQPLESLLSKFTPTMSTIPKTKEKQSLSDEAARIVSRFPDLSFMKSSVLMFPLKADTN